MAFDSDRTPAVRALPKRPWDLIVYTTRKGERLECRIPARSEAEAIRILLRRKMFQERDTKVRSVRVREVPA